MPRRLSFPLRSPALAMLLLLCACGNSGPDLAMAITGSFEFLDDGNGWRVVSASVHPR